MYTEGNSIQIFLRLLMRGLMGFQKEQNLLWFQAQSATSCHTVLKTQVLHIDAKKTQLRRRILLSRLLFWWWYLYLFYDAVKDKEYVSVYDKYLVVVLQLLGNSCSCCNNNCITKLWAPDLNLSIYKWFYWHYFIEKISMLSSSL